MSALSILFALLGLLSLLALPIGLIRPRWLKLKTRVSAFFACLYVFTASVGIGMLIDPADATNPIDAFTMFIGVGVWHLLVLGWIMAFRKVSDPAFQAAKNERINNFFDKGTASLNELHAKVDNFAKEKQQLAHQQSENSDVISTDKLAKFEESLTTIWAGTTKTIEFTYEKPFDDRRSRRRVDVEELMYDSKSRLVIRGYCHEKGEERTFRESRIRTKIKCGSKRYDFDEWCVEVLDVNPYNVMPDY